jgi:hypothetical protein
MERGGIFYNAFIGYPDHDFVQTETYFKVLTHFEIVRKSDQCRHDVVAPH